MGKGGRGSRNVATKAVQCSDIVFCGPVSRPPHISILMLHGAFCISNGNLAFGTRGQVFSQIFSLFEERGLLCATCYVGERLRPAPLRSQAQGWQGAFVFLALIGFYVYHRE